MAFPTNAVLDTFNAGANQALTARAGWSATFFPSTTSTWTTDSVPTNAVGSTSGGNTWTLSSVLHMEAYCTLLTFSALNDEFSICARIQDVSGSPTYYALNIAHSSTTSIELVKLVAGTRTVLASGTRTHANGDSYGIDVIGTTINGYAKVGAGAWGTVLTASDGAISGAGSIGFQHHLSSASTLDNFGGGAVSAPPADTMAWPMSSYADTRHGVLFG